MGGALFLLLLLQTSFLLSGASDPVACSEVKSVYRDAQCCANAQADTCLRAIPSCTNSTATGHVCVDAEQNVVVKGLVELMNELSDAFGFSSNVISFKKHLIPEQNSQFDLGSAERKVRYIFNTV